MLLELKLLLSLVLIVSATYDVGNSQKIHITRGEEDVFSNPKCLGHQQAGCPSCDGFKAVCAEDNCTKCRCAGNDRTFVLTRGQYGQCVANEYFLYSTSHNSSFLVEEKASHKCLYQHKPKNSKYRFVLVTDTCNVSALAQRWVWTRDGQLLNLETFECLTEGWFYESYHFLILKRCSLKEKKQLWRCEQQKSGLFAKQDSNRYMNYGNYHTYITSYGNTNISSGWKRFHLDEPLCSEASGCDRSSDGSSLTVLDKTNCRRLAKCTGQKEIVLGMKTNSCDILPKQTQYLHDDVWKLLPLKAGVFKIYVNFGKVFLKWNLNGVPEEWRGIIVKLQFRCETDPIHRQQEKIDRARCILIKFSGAFSGFSPRPTTRSNEDNDGSKVTIIIIVCIILVGVAFAGATGLMFYKRGKRSCQPKESQRPITDQRQNTALHSVERSIESSNPLYSGGIGSDRECELYQSSPHHPYQYIDTDHKPIPQPLQDITYDYAINDGLPKFTGQCSNREIPAEDCTKGSNERSYNASNASDPGNDESKEKLNKQTLSHKRQIENCLEDKAKNSESLPKYHVLEEP